MNVKPGDLAIQIKSAAGNEGTLVEILEIAGEDPFFGGYIWDYKCGPCWKVKRPRPVMSTTGKVLDSLISILPDAWLRPVSGLPIEEETNQTEEV